MKVAAALVLGLSTAAAAKPASAPQKVIARIDLSKPFHLPPGASFTATQGPRVVNTAIENPLNGHFAKEPGRIHLCIRVRAKGACAPDLDNGLDSSWGREDIHFLQIVEVVYPRGAAAAPLFHVQVGSLHSTDGGQGRAADFLAYRPAEHRFELIFKEVLGSNGNEEVRYIASGPLRGDKISAEPTDNAPYGYWVTVDQLTPDYRYKQVLRYRSATHYGDGNRLAVIDSEMPNILRRLGLWRAGQPLPLPKSGCAKPRLVKSALWCS